MNTDRILDVLIQSVHSDGGFISGEGAQSWALLLLAAMLVVWSRGLFSAIAMQAGVSVHPGGASLADGMRDALTGLPGQVLLEQRLRATCPTHPEGLLVIGVDCFKEINRFRGHAFGDRLLQLIAMRIRFQAGTEAFLARLPGDEFALLVRFEDVIEIKAAARRLLRSMESSFHIDGVTVGVTISIGIAVDDAERQHREQLFTHASLALQEAKDSGRNRFCLFNAAMSSSEVEIESAVRDLRKALSANQMSLVYQPKQDLKTGAVVGLEALLRWQHPTLGAVAPDYFIPLAEKTGMIVEVGRWVLEEACRQMRSWRDELGFECKVSVNASVFQINSPSFILDVATALERHSLPPSCLSIEVTESSAMNHVQATIAVLSELSDAGITISMDDFGVGHSSLAHLKRLPIHEVKIDRNFVGGIVDSEEDAAIVRAIIVLAKAVGLYVVAEGVETYEQQALLAEMECDAVQGYLIGRPIHASELAGSLGRWTVPTHVFQRFLRT